LLDSLLQESELHLSFKAERVMDDEDVMSMESPAESDAELSDAPILDTDDRLPKLKPGIIYLSTVPNGYNVSQTTAFFSEFGRVGRVFLQPEKNDRKPGKFNKERLFTEGWVEFKSKKVAKSVADTLNRNPVGGKRRSKAHDELWNIKYLPRFKWIHLSERLAYESAVKQQRLRTEISQVKREAEHFKNSVERKKKRAKKDHSPKSSKDTPAEKQSGFQFKQRETEAQIKKRKRDENKFTIKDIDESETKSKKTKKASAAADNNHLVKVKVKSKGGKKEKALGVRKEGDRSQFLKSVFGGGGAV